MSSSKPSRVKLNRIKYPGGTIASCCDPGVVQWVLLMRECALPQFFPNFRRACRFDLMPFDATPVEVAI